jgi:hypothetical protein
MKKVVKGKGKWNIEKQIEEEILSWKKKLTEISF